MNEVEAQAERLQWSVDDVDESDYDSESLSGSDGSEGEVPVVTGEADTSSKLLATGTGKPHSSNNTHSGYPPKHSIIANPGLKEGGGAFIRGWKPVIDGKIQVSGGEAGAAAAAHKVRSSSMQQAVAASGAAAAPATTVSQKHSSSDNASASPAGTGASEPKVEGNESDSDVRRVPEMSAKGGGASGATSAQPQGQSSGTRSRKRGGAPADKEHKRLKRLLRNRVSAQQARERKKAYLGDLEVRSKELQQRNEELEDRVVKLERENMMLRQIVKNTTSKKPGGGGAGD